MSKKILSAIVLAGLVLSLVAACSSNGSNGGDCTVAKSGSSSEKVTVTGKIGTAPKVKVPKLTAGKTTERSVIIDGKGKTAEDGNSVDIDYTVFNGTTGKQIDATGYTKDSPAAVTLDKTSLIPGLYKAVLCSTVGSRLVAVIPPADAFGSAGSSDLGIGAKDPIVFVIDVVSTKKLPKVLKKANGTPQTPKAGFPTVKLAADGTPTVTIPDGAPPADFQLEVLKKGKGAKVGAASNVTVQYQGIIWASKTVFNNSWPGGTPAQFNTAQVIPGFTQALVGQTVGSQVLAIIPPALGYGPQGGGPSGSGISATDTLVFIVDILASDG